MQSTTETSRCEACCAFCLNMFILVYSLSSVCASEGKDEFVCRMYATLVVLADDEC